MGSSRKTGVNWRSTATIRPDEMPGRDYIVWLDGRLRSAFWMPERHTWLVGMQIVGKAHPPHFATVEGPE